MGMTFTVEELFVVKHKSKYNCETTVFFIYLSILLKITVTLIILIIRQQ